jgi:hypothetical protein
VVVYAVLVFVSAGIDAHSLEIVHRRDSPDCSTSEMVSFAFRTDQEAVRCETNVTQLNTLSSQQRVHRTLQLETECAVLQAAHAVVVRAAEMGHGNSHGVGIFKSPHTARDPRRWAAHTHHAVVSVGTRGQVEISRGRVLPGHPLG